PRFRRQVRPDRTGSGAQGAERGPLSGRVNNRNSMHDAADHTEFVTFTTAGQLFGVPIGRVQDVFKPSRITRVPLAGAEIAGVLNLRGRIVTMVDLRRRLDLERGASDRPPIAIGIEARGESFGLLVDAIGE